MPSIDYDRGVEKRRTVKGVDVYMYQDQPGVYLNAYGTEVEPALAKQAGFDTVTLGKVQEKRRRVAAALAQIESEISDEVETQIITERDGFKLVSIGLDRYKVLDPDGSSLTPEPLTKAESQIVFDQVAPKPKQKAPAKAPAKQEADEAPKQEADSK